VAESHRIESSLGWFVFGSGQLVGTVWLKFMQY